MEIAKLVAVNFIQFSIQLNTGFRLHSTTWIEKPLGLFWLFRLSTADITIRYTTSSFTFKRVEKLEQSWATVYTKPAGKNPSKEKNSAGNLGRIHGSCSEKPILRRLHGWKVFCPYLQNKYSNKGRQTLNNLRKRKQAKKPLRNSNCH